MSDGSSDKHERHKTPEHSHQIGWTPTVAILYTAFLYFGAQFFAGLALGIIAAIFGLTITQGIPSQFFFVVASDAVMVWALWLFLRSRRSGFGQLGFGRAFAAKDFGYALVGYAVYFVLLLVALWVIGPLTGINLEQEQELGFDHLFSTTERLMAFIALVALPPIVEELIFRGFLFTSLRKRMTFFWATLITGILFASPHLLASSEGLLWVAGVDTFVLSFVLCYLREKTGALWAPIVVHAIKNSIAYVLMLTAVR